MNIAPANIIAHRGYGMSFARPIPLIRGWHTTKRDNWSVWQTLCTNESCCLQSSPSGTWLVFDIVAH